MPFADILLVVRWWGTLFLVGAAAFPLTKALFGSFVKGQYKSGRMEIDTLGGWYDSGYLFAKAVGMATVGWLVYALGTLKILPFTVSAVVLALILLFVIGALFQVTSDKQQVTSNTNKNKSFNLSLITLRLLRFHSGQVRLVQAHRLSLFLYEELFFLAALLIWSWVKAHEPSIRGLEKFMDYGFMQSILNSRYFPPADMWYPPFPINYYYFGHLVTAVLTKLSGLDLAYTFNLMLATIFALTLTMSFSIGKQISQIGHIRPIGQILGGLLTAFLVTLAGNMQTIYAFTQGYLGEDVKPLWQLLWPLAEFWQRLPEGLERYWYANATRFIPLTIHEFPSYSFVVSDVHGHVLSIPFALLAIGLLIQKDFFSLIASHLSLAFYGFLVGVLLMTNALDGPIYLGLLAVVLVAVNGKRKTENWKEVGKIVGVVTLVALVTSLPFLSHFKSFVTGLAVNCPPSFLANTKIGPLIFEGVEKCQRSPLWMMWLLWGFFWFCGIALIMSHVTCHMSRDGKQMDLMGLLRQIWNTKFTQVEQILVMFFSFSLALIIFPEFFYFKDIYPAHFRSNTMFKLGYQAFILFSIASGYSIVTLLTTVSSNIKYQISNIKYTLRQSSGQAYQISKIFKTIFVILLMPQLFLVSIYPIFSVRSYFGGLKNYEEIYGLGWLEREYPDDYAAIEWLKKEISDKQEETSKIKNLSLITYHLSPLSLVEADGDSYTDYQRFSVFTGIPTIVGWAVHEWLWRGSYEVVAPRREEVRQIYESDDIDLTQEILTKYHVRYIVVGKLEREKFTNLQEWKFAGFGTEAFRAGETVIYEMR